MLKTFYVEVRKTNGSQKSILYYITIRFAIFIGMIKVIGCDDDGYQIYSLNKWYPTRASPRWILLVSLNKFLYPALYE